MRLSDKRVLNKNWLHREYVIKKKSVNQIKKETGLGHGTTKKYLKKYGIKIRTSDNELVKLSKGHRKQNHPKWRGKMNNGGYRYIYMPSHPNSPKTGYINEHRFLVEQKIGRCLSVEEFVHHIDMDKENNNIKNLFLCRNRTQHHNIHSSFNKLCRKLIKNGMVYFDKKSETYKIRRGWIQV